jgi:single-strand DNA-binding protein
MNKAILIGNVGKDPEIRQTGGGTDVASFSLATTKRWRDKDGEKKEETTWHNIVVFGALCKVVEPYVKKGSKISVEGAIRNRQYTAKDGSTKYISEIVVDNLELLGERGHTGAPFTPESQRAPSERKEPAGDMWDDPIPF